MSDVPVQIVVAAFQDEKAADAALKELKDAKRAGLIKIDDAAVIRKDQKGKLHIKETADMKPGKGAGIGALVGGVVGLLAGPAGVVLGAGAGALIGGVAAAPDKGIKDERLEKIGDSLEPGTSAIVAIVEHKWVEKVEEALEEEAADVLTETLSADIHEQLTAGKEVSFSAIADESGVAMERVAGNESEVEVSKLVATDEGMVAATAVATEDGVAAEMITATADGVTDEVVVATADEVDYVGVAITDDEVVGVAAVATPAVEGEAAIEGEVEETADEGEAEAEESGKKE